jgi:hypothetical protein
VQSRAGRFARNVVGGTALRLPPVARKVAGTVSGLGIDYPQAPRAADVALLDSRRLYEVLRDGRFVLLAPESAGAYLDGAHDHVVLASPVDAHMPWTLVRPDAHVAWSGAPDRLGAALRQAGLHG